MRLSKSQKQALGIKKQEEIQHFVWNKKLCTLFEPIDEANFDFDESQQSFPQFLQMLNRQPNEEGTGRFKTSYFQRIEAIFILKEKAKAPSRDIKNVICKFLSTILRIRCEFNPRIKLQVDGNRHIVDKKTGTLYQTKSINQSIDAHDLLSVLREHKNQKTILLAFVQNQLNEEGVQIDGRAYGDGVASISFQASDLQQNLKFYCETGLHETLHTLGFDHCQTWKCLMNAYTNSQSLFCPLCTRKLYHQLNINSSEAAITWLKQVISLFVQFKARDTIKKGQMMVKYIS